MRQLRVPEGSLGVARRQRERQAGCERWAGPGDRGGARSGAASPRTLQSATHRSYAPPYLPRPHGLALVTATLHLTLSQTPVKNHFRHTHVFLEQFANELQFSNVLNKRVTLVIRNLICFQKCISSHVEFGLTAQTNIGWDQFDHPLYSPNLSPNDYHLFLHLQSFLKN